ncbi:MAG: 50S ribosomal protein L7ae [Candidatus Diapherotrites archaeon]|nr:50S ribosomal protein L7ae [Candidatus Diapherotrites archaeon]
MEFNVPEELMAEQLRVLEKISEKGKLRIGVNEVTKAIEREQAKLVFIAQDVEPKEIVMHLPLLCEEKGIPYTFVKTKKELGEKAGIEVSASSVAVVDAGAANKEFAELVKKIQELKAKKEKKEKGE